MEEGEAREADGDGSSLHEEHLVDELVLLADDGVFRIIGEETSRLQASIHIEDELLVVLDGLEHARVNVCKHVIGDDFLFDEERQPLEVRGNSVLVFALFSTFGDDLTQPMAESVVAHFFLT